TSGTSTGEVWSVTAGVVVEVAGCGSAGVAVTTPSVRAWLGAEWAGVGDSALEWLDTTCVPALTTVTTTMAPAATCASSRTGACRGSRCQVSSQDRQRRPARMPVPPTSPQVPAPRSRRYLLMVLIAA